MSKIIRFRLLDFNISNSGNILNILRRRPHHTKYVHTYVYR